MRVRSRLILAAALAAALGAIVASKTARAQGGGCAWCRIYVQENTCDVPTMSFKCDCCPSGGKT